MSEAPAELWLRPTDMGRWYRTIIPDEPDAVRYVRADLYEALQARVNENPSQYDALRQQLNAQRPLPAVNYALRLSDEDVARIADAVVLWLRAEADNPR